MKYIKDFIINLKIAYQRKRNISAAWNDALFFAKLFNSKKNNNEPYSILGSVGVSPEYLKMYEETMKKINETK